MSSDLISYFEVYTLIFGLLSLVGSNPTPATYVGNKYSELY